MVDEQFEAYVSERSQWMSVMIHKRIMIRIAALILEEAEELEDVTLLRRLHDLAESIEAIPVRRS